MAFVEEIGEVVETYNETLVEWKIKDFFSLSEKEDDFYHSPVFSFADSFWHLIMYPNGQAKYNSTGWTDFYLARNDSGSPKHVSLTLGIKYFANDECLKSFRFTTSQRELIQHKFLSRSILSEHKAQIMPSNSLTIRCKLISNVAIAARSSLYNRLRKVGRNLQSILTERKSTDFTLIYKDCEWQVHEAILRSRSEYFETMFQNEWAETTSGEVKFNEINEDALDTALYFMYSGEVNNMSVSNVCRNYVCAQLLFLKDLKTMCIEYMKNNMDTAIFCDAIKSAYTYDDEELKEISMKFFVQEAEQMIEHKEWKQLKAENPSLIFKILEKTVQQEAEPIKRIKLATYSQIQPVPSTSGLRLFHDYQRGNNS